MQLTPFKKQKHPTKKMTLSLHVCECKFLPNKDETKKKLHKSLSPSNKLNKKII